MPHSVCGTSPPATPGVPFVIYHVPQGIYPTLIIALVALNKSGVDTQPSGYSLPTSGGSFPLSPLSRASDLTRSAWSSDLSTVGDVRKRSHRPTAPDPFAKRMPSETSTHVSEETVHWQDDGSTPAKESFVL